MGPFRSGVCSGCRAGERSRSGAYAVIVPPRARRERESETSIPCQDTPYSTRRIDLMVRSRRRAYDYVTGYLYRLVRF